MAEFWWDEAKSLQNLVVKRFTVPVRVYPSLARVPPTTTSAHVHAAPSPGTAPGSFPDAPAQPRGTDQCAR